MTRDEDMFPKGLRVLVVDDNPTCLRILERLLQNCSYEVTITTEAIIALQMLRENKDKFDIVISDVHMPNMDGFALLEHIGLELDIPVIMLSANDDPKSVMRGVKHGAVDYLLKPVRIEELKNIWQHVVRKNQQKKQKEKAVCNSEAGEVSKDGNSHTNPDETLTKKRKDQINKEGDAGEGEQEQEQEQEERRSDNAEILSQKKQRVVWSPELHKQFVIAVDQLGADKAFPKKILDLMNVEGLTRENVASHLQKYRLYLKRMNATLGQSGAPSLPFGIQDSSIYLNGGSLLNPFGTLCSLGGGVGKSQSATASTQYTTGTGGMFGQFNTAASYPSNLSQRATNIGKSLLQNQGVGGSRMMDMGNFQQQNNNNNRSALIISSSSLQNKEEFGNQTPVITVPMELRPQVVAPLADYARRLENWRSSTVALQPVQQNLSNQNQPSSIDVSQLQAALEHSFTTNASLNGGQQGLDSLGVQNVSYNIVEPQIWQPNMDGTTNISTCYNNNPMVPANGSSYQSFEDSNSAQFNNNVDPITGEVTGNNSGFMQQNIIEENDVDALIELDDNYYLDDSEILGFTQNESESLEDIVGKLHK